jgi:acetyl esterase/lipase
MKVFENMIKYIVLLCIFYSFSSKCVGQNYTIPLWPDKIPNHQTTDEVEKCDTTEIISISYVQIPDITVYLPSKGIATGQALVICPGGGYHILAYDWEGTDIAKWLNSIGIAAIVLKYRLPVSQSNIVSHKSPLLDAQRAVRLTRHHAEEWNIETNKIGVMGFSAGGHLASTLGTHYDSWGKSVNDSIEMISSRPDFMILIYPVITFLESYTHMGSRNALIGVNPDTSLVIHYSNERHVNSNTPPTILVHASDDKAVPVENSLLFYKSLIDSGVSAEMHIYAKGGHGFALAIGKGYLATWVERCADWLQNLNYQY